MPARHPSVPEVGGVVVFSILIQGLTVGRLTRAWLVDRPEPAEPSPQTVGG
jgi:hypothetical protein